MLQILIALLAGILTVGAPCILPMTPILLGSAIGSQNKTRPLFITIGFVLAFSLVGLLFGIFSSVLGLSANALRSVAIVFLALFGIFMIWPMPFEKVSAYMSRFIGKAQQNSQKAGQGNWGGLVLGVMLGIIWTPCAGPVLGSILTLIATQSNLAQASALLTAYAIGAGIPMLLIAYGGQVATTKVRSLARYATRLQQIFGLIILALAIAMYFQYDLWLQARLLQYYPGGQLTL